MLDAIAAQRVKVATLSKDLRNVRHERWSSTVATLWQERPGVVNHWLYAAGSPCGTTPILNAKGMQCTPLCTFGAAVQEYWVHSLLRRRPSVEQTA